MTCTRLSSPSRGATWAMLRNDDVKQLVPIILCGGSGTRLWPLSRVQMPKQFLPLLGADSLLHATLKRVARLQELPGLHGERCILVTHESYRFLVAEQLRSCGFTADVLLEPERRDTAPALTLAAHVVSARHPGALLWVLPSDQVFHDEHAFFRAMASAIDAADEDTPGAFGATIDSTCRSESALEVEESDGALRLVRLRRRVDNEAAATTDSPGRWLRNSGIYLLGARWWLDAARHLVPAMEDACGAATRELRQDLDFIRVGGAAFADSPSLCIEEAVMGRLASLPTPPRTRVTLLGTGWSDLATWPQVMAEFDADGDGNRCRGDVLTVTSRNNSVFSSHRLVSLVGVDGLVVVETPDAVLVTRPEQAHRIDRVVALLAERGRTEHIEHKRVHRPWGYYEGIDEGERFQVKHLFVNPGASLSLQLHHHRAEHWVVVHGTAEVTRGSEVFRLSENESTFVPLGARHRLHNPGKVPLEMIEIQSGNYLGEDDIVRFSDDYGRVPGEPAA